MKRLLTLVAALTSMTATAHAAPRPLGEADHASLSGDSAVLSTTRGRAVTVTRAPLAGGAATPLLDYEAPARRRPEADLAASGERAGVVITLTRPRGFLDTAQAFLGPATGPLAALDPPTAVDGPAFTPSYFAMAGDTAFLLGGEGPNLRDRLDRIAPDGTRTTADFGGEALSSVAFGGDYAAYGDHVGNEGNDNPANRLVVRNWRTGETVRDERADPGVVGLDVRADGAVVMETDGAGIRVYPSAGTPTRIARHGSSPVWAGDNVIVHISHPQNWRTLRLIAPDGSSRPFGVPSQDIGDLSADAANVVWQANGCALTAPLTEPAGTAIAAGPCAHSEAFVTSQITRVRRALRLRVRCLSATATCTGTLSGRRLRSTAFDIAPAQGRPVAVPLTRTAFQRLSEPSRYGDALTVHLHVDDGNTQRFVVQAIPQRKRR
jgi:hypothetical protein